MRKIFTVLAFIVDANGAYHILDGYPKTFDTRNYANDEHKTYLRAIGDAHETFGAMCKVDTRKIQTVIVLDEGGNTIVTFTTGDLVEPEVVSE